MFIGFLNGILGGEKAVGGKRKLNTLKTSNLIRFNNIDDEK